MRKFKPLPQVSKEQYEVVEELADKKYKLTPESQRLRDKTVELLMKHRVVNTTT